MCRKPCKLAESRAMLLNFLDTQLFERQGKAITNFEDTLPPEKATVLAKYATGVVKVPIGISEFELAQVMPKDFVSTLPTIAELETELK